MDYLIVRLLRPHVSRRLRVMSRIHCGIRRLSASHLLRISEVYCRVLGCYRVDDVAVGDAVEHNNYDVFSSSLIFM